jgi:hypothetical protein
VVLREIASDARAISAEYAARTGIPSRTALRRTRVSGGHNFDVGSVGPNEKRAMPEGWRLRARRHSRRDATTPSALSNALPNLLVSRFSEQSALVGEFGFDLHLAILVRPNASRQIG